MQAGSHCTSIFRAGAGIDRLDRRAAAEQAEVQICKQGRLLRPGCLVNECALQAFQ
jgi:hypothetical protein